MKKKTIIIGIETSCDETAVSILEDNGKIDQKFYQMLFQVNLKFIENLVV